MSTGTEDGKAAGKEDVEEVVEEAWLDYPHWQHGTLARSDYRELMYEALTYLNDKSRLPYKKPRITTDGSFGDVQMREGDFGEKKVVLDYKGMKVALKVPRCWQKTWKRPQYMMREIRNTQLATRLVRNRISPCFPMLVGAGRKFMQVESVGICLWDILNGPAKLYGKKKAGKWLRDPSSSRSRESATYRLLQDHALDVAFEIMYALAAMQMRLGMVHYDLKPDNVTIQVFDRVVTRHYVMKDVWKDADAIPGSVSAGLGEGKLELITIQNRIQPYIIDLGLATSPCDKERIRTRGGVADKRVLLTLYSHLPAYDITALAAYLLGKARDVRPVIPGSKLSAADGTEAAHAYPRLKGEGWDHVWRVVWCKAMAMHKRRAGNGYKLLCDVLDCFESRRWTPKGGSGEEGGDGSGEETQKKLLDSNVYSLGRAWNTQPTADHILSLSTASPRKASKDEVMVEIETETSATTKTKRAKKKATKKEGGD